MNTPSEFNRIMDEEVDISPSQLIQIDFECNRLKAEMGMEIPYDPSEKLKLLKRLRVVLPWENHPHRKTVSA